MDMMIRAWTRARSLLMRIDVFDSGDAAAGSAYEAGVVAGACLG